MVSVSSFVFLTCLITVSLASDPVTDGTQLVFSFVIHRQGDRTPVPSSLDVLGKSINQTLAIQLISPYGFGQLTDNGKRTSYTTGQYIRRRYNGLLSPKYNRSEIYIRTIDSTRVKMSSLATMSAVYPAGPDNWSKSINWTPVPYTTCPAKYDFLNLAFLNCPTYMNYEQSIRNSYNQGMQPYAGVIQKISALTGIDITGAPLQVFKVYDVCVSLLSLGYNLSSDIRNLLGELSQAHKAALAITFGNDCYLPLQAGTLLEEFFKYTTNIIAGIPTQKVRIYPGFDFNLMSFAFISGVKLPACPLYGAVYSLELRKNTATGQYFVVPVYLADPKTGRASYLQIQGCSGQFLCEYSEFLKLTLPYARDEATWMQECGWSPNLKVNTLLID